MFHMNKVSIEIDKLCHASQGARHLPFELLFILLLISYFWSQGFIFLMFQTKSRKESVKKEGKVENSIKVARERKCRNYNQRLKIQLKHN